MSHTLLAKTGMLTAEELDSIIMCRPGAIIRCNPDEITFVKEDIEENLRENSPAVKDAWEQYQIVLKLAKEN